MTAAHRYRTMDTEPTRVTDHNRQAWDAMVRGGCRHAQVVSEAELADPLRHLDAEGWLQGDVRGRRVLCLAAAGGYQSVLMAAAGAEVTVADLSGEMLQLDRAVAGRYGLALRLFQTSMEDLSMLPEASFDVVWQPVSTCYVPQVGPVYRQVARVMATGGLYVSQHKQPVSLQLSAEAQAGRYVVEESYYRHGPLPAVSGKAHREQGTLEYLHRWEELLGDLCRAGFVIEDFSEPCHADPHAAPGSFAHRALTAPPYMRIKARRHGNPIAGTASSGPAALWLPPAT